jgi:hypothetical protein
VHQSGFSKQGILAAVVIAVIGLGGVLLLAPGADDPIALAPTTTTAPGPAAAPASAAAPAAPAAGTPVAPSTETAPPGEPASEAGAPAATPATVKADPSTTPAAAQRHAQNAMSQTESCYTDTQDYTQCTTATQLGNTGLALGTGPNPAPGEVSIVASSAGAYMIRAADAQGQLWQIVRDSADDTKLDRVCMLRDESSFCPTPSW